MYEYEYDYRQLDDAKSELPINQNYDIVQDRN